MCAHQEHQPVDIVSGRSPPRQLRKLLVFLKLMLPDTRLIPTRIYEEGPQRIPVGVRLSHEQGPVDLELS
jgi:hypothetical protein